MVIKFGIIFMFCALLDILFYLYVTLHDNVIKALLQFFFYIFWFCWLTSSMDARDRGKEKDSGTRTTYTQ